MSAESEYDAIVLAGGAGRRLGGVDKAALEVGGRTLLDRVLAALVDARRVVVVGPSRSLPPGVIVTSEQPPGGGPVAGLAAGLDLVEAPLVAVLACDLPFVTVDTLRTLLAALEPTLPSPRTGPSWSTSPDADSRWSPSTGRRACGRRYRSLVHVSNTSMRAMLGGVDDAGCRGSPWSRRGTATPGPTWIARDGAWTSISWRNHDADRVDRAAL